MLFPDKYVRHHPCFRNRPRWNGKKNSCLAYRVPIEFEGNSGTDLGRKSRPPPTVSASYFSRSAKHVSNTGASMDESENKSEPRFDTPELESLRRLRVWTARGRGNFTKRRMNLVENDHRGFSLLQPGEGNRSWWRFGLAQSGPAPMHRLSVLGIDVPSVWGFPGCPRHPCHAKDVWS